MKTLPLYPYLQNIVREYRNQYADRTDGKYYWEGYREYMQQFGFKCPIENAILEFPDDYSDTQIMLFVLKYG